MLKIVYFAIMKFERSVKTTDSNYLFTETAFEYTLVIVYIAFFRNTISFFGIFRGLI